ncbi:hypothetical protein AB3X82_16515 [Paraburkholderia phenoliruptrix]|uniref:TniQ protein n=1 Tax=Paraburkholderia phenoliruptrix TaxID=252970 RepID=A0ABV3WEM4_9BURK
MQAYPSVNWWPGNILPHESRVSFAARFRDLNGISARRCLDFLDIDLEEGSAIGPDTIERLSSILREPVHEIESLFQPSLRFVGCDPYAPPPPNAHDRRFVRYCEACACRGYHSHLHEREWLSRCPFHRCELKDAYPPVHTGSIAARRVEALDRVMRNHCPSWPRCDDARGTASDEVVAALREWVLRASRSAARLSSAEIWCTGRHLGAYWLSSAQAFGQLRALAPMPETIEVLLADTGGTWRMDSLLFPAVAKTELERLNALGLSFARVIEVFQGISPSSPDPPSFVANLRAVKGLLSSRHGSCHCKWALVRGGWESHWVRVHADEQPYWATPCPFEVALEDLDRGWGGLDYALTGRRAMQKEVRYLELVREMHAAGLVRYIEGAEVSDKGYLYIGQDLPSSCRWADDSPLTELLNTASIWEIESAYGAISTWLDNIDEGAPPGHRADPRYCVRVVHADEGLHLIRWVAASSD